MSGSSHKYKRPTPAAKSRANLLFGRAPCYPESELAGVLLFCCQCCHIQRFNKHTTHAIQSSQTTWRLDKLLKIYLLDIYKSSLCFDANKHLTWLSPRVTLIIFNYLPNTCHSPILIVLRKPKHPAPIFATQLWPHGPTHSPIFAWALWLRQVCWQMLPPRALGKLHNERNLHMATWNGHLKSTLLKSRDKEIQRGVRYAPKMALETLEPLQLNLLLHFLWLHDRNHATSHCCHDGSWNQSGLHSISAMGLFGSNTT